MSKKDEIETKIGDNLIFNDKWTRIYIKTNNVNLSEENAKWSYEKKMLFVDIIKPYLDEFSNK